MPVTFPAVVARFNQRVNNPLQGHWAWLLPPWVLILHRGRRTGRAFATPAFALRRGDELIVPLLYGRESQWVQNLQAAGGGEIARGGRRYVLGPPRITDRPPPGLGPVGRRILASAHHQLVAPIGPQLPGGPRELHALRPRSRRRGS